MVTYEDGFVESLSLMNGLEVDDSRTNPLKEGGDDENHVAFHGDSPSEGNELVFYSSFGMPSLLCRPIKEESMDLDYLCDRELVQESYDQVDENVINFGVQTQGDDSLMEISAQEFQRKFDSRCSMNIIDQAREKNHLEALDSITIDIKIIKTDVAKISLRQPIKATWTSSQDLKLKEVLLALLTQIRGKLPDDYLEKTKGDLVQALWRSLKRHRYLVFLDDKLQTVKGLPLTIVVVAGILSNTKQEASNEILESLRSGIISSTEQCHNAIELSYRCLPEHLKSCLLLFGVYPEDHVVSVKRLIWYWIAEGFVQKSKLKSLEEVATDYFKEFDCPKLGYGDPKKLQWRCWILSKLKLETSLGFPSEIGLLVQLIFLAIQVTYERVSPSIGNLSNLEILILRGQSGVVFPKTFWNLQKLRHLHLTSMGSGIELRVNDNLDGSSNLYELVSFSTLISPNWSIMEKLLRKLPNIRQLRCELYGSQVDPNPSIGRSLMSFSFLSRLESLHLSFWQGCTSCSELVFPEKLKKLTLYGGEFPWEKFKPVAQLPHLEVLKIIDDYFVGETWNVEEGEFPELRFLKLQSLEFVKWTVSDGYEFPNLQKLVLQQCRLLEEIPVECSQNTPTLDMIEVYNCLDCVTDSVDQIREAQIDFGNSGFQVLVRSHIEVE
ncbi:OLC1v1018850C1 [Oldenlandia corymbosa var. corymbosa]|uniref:OLC1v1018850C1 n=1 Tax=Oldenlandia corymbosa var. corymbosa TaxID=529605 RepID=A0AAV1ED06_OLDCO|nr:OLC1v1018850C1 [Oldenlandia corymbosa var. corymbosa]